jgi:hypothetical protein
MGDALHVVTFFQLRGPWNAPRFFGMSRRIAGQLRGTEGLVGFSMLAKPLRNRYWTASVWRDRRALLRFIRENPHALAMKRFPPLMRSFDMIRWTGPPQVPLPWAEALRRLPGD